MAVETLPDQTDGPKNTVIVKVRAVKRHIKPWYIYALVATSVVTLVVVLTAVLVTRRNHTWAVEVERTTPSNPIAARVNLGYAQYQGSLVGTNGGVAQYLGLRYAAPPTGDRRWRAPAEPEVDDSGDQAADTFGPICLGISVQYPTSDGSEDEDCLYANVWAPANATVNSKLPVWLFIQGGGYTTNSNANWNGSYLVEASGQSIVFVNFNYRVGLWGFLASDRVRADGELNVGLRDQIAMLRWVRRYIAQFGGDPDHVVITGTSAGAGSVALHLLMACTGYGNATDGGDGGSGEKLFVGGVGESVFFPAQPLLADLEWQFDLLLAQTGCTSSQADDDALSCLRGLDTSTLQSYNVPSAFPDRPGLPAPLPLFYWTPCVDGDLLRDFPSVLFERGEYVDVPVVMGTTTNEGTAFAYNASTADELATFLQDNYPNLTSAQASSVVDQYPPSAQTPLPLHAAWFPSTAAAYGESTFICPASLVLDSYLSSSSANATANSTSNATNAAPVWGYRYNVYDALNAAAGLGVPHIWESWAVYGPDSQDGVGGGPASYYTTAASVVQPVMDYWISFVRTLDPNALKAIDAPVWERWGNGTNGGRRLVMQTENFTMETVPADEQARCEFWKGLVPTTQQ
ncbi:alpha/beta-hydrolase [Jackrogersella minutella]|nr:alpha/beta-hydrolase [Jackrogersella minutella]